jgi:hypothetical protein
MGSNARKSGIFPHNVNRFGAADFFEKSPGILADLACSRRLVRVGSIGRHFAGQAPTTGDER